MTDEMDAEFDTVAEWTGQVARDLGSEFYLPAACRGSGQPSALEWLIAGLELRRHDRMLDCGAGVGGPAAFAGRKAGVRPVLTDPEIGACRAAKSLFDLPVLQAGSELPFSDRAFDVVWSLGVLCTVQDQPHLLSEVRRVLKPNGRLGLLVFVARSLPLPDQPSGNNFPTEEVLDDLLTDARFRVTGTALTDDLPAPTEDWADRTQQVEDELERRYGGSSEWQTATSQSGVIGSLLASGDLRGMLLTARPE